MVTGTNLTSAVGVLSLLDEPEEDVQIFALARLNELVDLFWAEISESISKIESLYENPQFPQRELSALVASKVYYHLGSLQDSRLYALHAGPMFDINDTSEYTETIISECIDHYTTLRVKKFEDTLDLDDTIDPRLESVVDRMFEKCFDEGRYQQAAGIAFETRRIDILERAILESKDRKMMLSYCLKVTMSLLSSKKFQTMVLQILVRIYSNLKSPDYINICQCYIFLDEVESTVQILEKLCRGSPSDLLYAYQIAFDLYESATQNYLTRVSEAIQGILPKPPPSQTEAQPSNDDKKAEDITEKMEVSGQEKEKTNEGEVKPEEVDDNPKQDDTSSKEEAMDVEESEKPSETTVTSNEKTVDSETDSEPELETEEDWVTRLRSITFVLSGQRTISLHQEFLIRNNHTDLQILKNTKEAGRNSITHNAILIANGFMHYGTTSDIFLRENLDWLKRASNWGKFIATASLGVIHYGHEKEALNLMSSYLPKDSSGSPYSEGGGLYALGLIHANHGQDIVEYLIKELVTNQHEVVRHGGCLGLGLAAMGTANLDVYQLLKDNLCQDDAVVGEAAGVAMGLVMLGTRSSVAVKDMIDYAQETQHEKIQRGLALGIAMLFYGQLEEAVTAIEQLCHHKDPLLRRAGMFTIGMAYCGTGDNNSVRRLLHVAVSDVDSDVRRAAVTCIGFILFRNPEQCPNVVSLLAESFNPHVRCGAAWALGIACAASGSKEALSILEPMLSDPVPFVQQGALVASAMIIIQHTETMIKNSKVMEIRKKYAKLISDRLEDTVAKFGAILAQGIVDAGGRNVTICLQSRTGHTQMQTVVGLLVFSQFWFWFPFSHFLSLAFSPTAIIGLNCNLQMPKFKLKSNARPSQYGYIPHLEKEKGKEREKVATAVLSVTAKKTKGKLKKQQSGLNVGDKKGEEQTDSGGGQGGLETMEVDPSGPPDAKRKKESDDLDPPLEEVKESGEGSETKGSENIEDKASSKEDSGDGDKEKKSEPEPLFEMLSNPARVLPQQLKVISLESPSRYKSLKPINSGGIILLKNTETETPEVLIEPLKVLLPGEDDEEEEPLPPEPFEYIEDDS